MPVAADDVAIIVPVRDEQDSLAPFIDSLLAQDSAPCEIIVCDAGSTDGSALLVRERLGDRGRVVADGPAFPGRARNIAIGEARTRWIAMTDAGTIAPRGWLRELTDAADRHPDAAVVFGSYEPLIASSFEKCVALAFVAPMRHVDGSRFRGPSTASLLLHKSVWQEVGGFPVHLRACEDLLFFDRLVERGYRMVCAPGAIVQWRVPSSWSQVFRRFRAYSCHTLKAGLGHRWHRAVATMYLAAAAALVGALIFHWSMALLPIVGLVWRTRRSVVERGDIVEAAGSVNGSEYATVALLLLWIDLAALVGVVDYLTPDRRST
jgi:cellulose synthase/poly-beta-1,6-N-acetylglucosamine synthase-like glycosyltransferase